MSLLLMVWLSVMPQGEMLLRGAIPSASDASTPVPEQGRVATGLYRNAYFGLSYPIPAGWKEQPAGPPPSDGGSYVLTQFATARAHVLVSAQDLFFSALPAAGAKELLAAVRERIEPQYEIESEPSEVMIAGRTFHRLAYKAPRSGLRWRILSTDSRCHALTFNFTGTDIAALDAAEQAMDELSLSRSAPPCVRDYDKVVERNDPFFTTNRHNTIPVRLIIDKKGRVKHAHVLSAFPEQSHAILIAVRTWRFEPYRVGGRGVEVETGVVFGVPQAARAARRIEN
jgi:hypothetical protein